MLAESVRKLARESYVAPRNAAAATFAQDLRKFNSKLQEDGFVGSPGRVALKCSFETICARYKAAAGVLLQACRSEGVRADPNLSDDLLSASRELVTEYDVAHFRGPALEYATVSSDDPAAQLANIELINHMWNPMTIQAIAQGTAEAKVEFDHFAAEHRRDRARAATEGRGKWLLLAVGAAIGIVSTHFNDIIKWATQLHLR